MASNIAEGRGWLSPLEFRQFLGLAHGSLCELRTQMLVAKRLGMAKSEAMVEGEGLCEEMSKLLTSFIKTLSLTKKLKAVS